MLQFADQVYKLRSMSSQCLLDFILT